MPGRVSGTHRLSILRRPGCYKMLSRRSRSKSRSRTSGSSDDIKTRRRLLAEAVIACDDRSRDLFDAFGADVGACAHQRECFVGGAVRLNGEHAYCLGDPRHAFAARQPGVHGSDVTSDLCWKGRRTSGLFASTRAAYVWVGVPVDRWSGHDSFERLCCVEFDMVA
jgi:hypothetical protein